MSVIGIIVLLIVAGLLLWLVNTFIPMDPKVKQLLNVVIIILLVAVVIWFLLGLFGVSGASFGTAFRPCR